MKVCIIIPSYNEEKRIKRVLEDYCKFFSRKKGLKFEILVVINNTKDNTEKIVKDYMKKCKGLKYLNFQQGGKGFAIKKGFEYAISKKFDLIGFVDADDSVDAKNFYKVLKNTDSFDGTIASRYVKGSKVKPKQPITRIFVSRIGNFIIRSLFLLPYKDTQCGGKIFKEWCVKRIVDKLSITDWAFDIDLLYNLNKIGCKLKEIPIFWKDSWGSKIKTTKSSIQVFLAILQLRIVNSPFKRILKPIKPFVRWLYKQVR